MMTLDEIKAMTPWARTQFLLERTLARVSEGWCQGAEARDQHGELTSVYAKNACQWCLSGAKTAAYEEIGPSMDMGLSVEEYHRLSKEVNVSFYLMDEILVDLAFPDGDYPCEVMEDSLIDWNDRRGRTQGEVVQLVDDALALHAEDKERGDDG